MSTFASPLHVRLSIKVADFDIMIRFLFSPCSGVHLHRRRCVQVLDRARSVASFPLVVTDNTKQTHFVHFKSSGDSRRERAEKTHAFFGTAILHAAVAGVFAVCFIAGSDFDFVVDNFFGVSEGEMSRLFWCQEVIFSSSLCDSLRSVGRHPLPHSPVPSPSSSPQVLFASIVVAALNAGIFLLVVLSFAGPPALDVDAAPAKPSSKPEKSVAAPREASPVPPPADPRKSVDNASVMTAATPVLLSTTKSFAEPDDQEPSEPIPVPPPMLAEDPNDAVLAVLMDGRDAPPDEQAAVGADDGAANAAAPETEDADGGPVDGDAHNFAPWGDLSGGLASFEADK